MTINLDKSKVWFSPTIEDNKRNQITNTLQIRQDNDLGMYLGYPLKPSYKPANFQFLIDKIQKKKKL